MPARISRATYADMYGPTTGDRVRLADTDLIVEVERDFTTYGEEVKFGGGKVIRDGMGQSQLSRAQGAVDTVITNAVIIDHWGIIKADIGLKDGRIASIGKAGNPQIQPGVDIIIGPGTEVIAAEGKIVTAGGFDTHIHFICPQQIDEALRQHQAALAQVPVVISIIAGVGPDILARYLPDAAIVRAMPNLPVALGQGVVALHAPGIAASVRTAVDGLMAPLGLALWLDTPADYDAVGALAGTGPAFLFRFIDALAAAGRAIGLDDEQAARIALATVAGAAAQARTAGAAPAVLADRVASPGGMTRAGLDVLDAGRRLDTLLVETLAAVMHRRTEMEAAAASAN